MIARVACWIGRGSSCSRWSRGGLLGRRHTGLGREERIEKDCMGRVWWLWWGSRRRRFDGRDLPYFECDDSFLHKRYFL